MICASPPMRSTRFHTKQLRRWSAFRVCASRTGSGETDGRFRRQAGVTATSNQTFVCGVLSTPELARAALSRRESGPLVGDLHPNGFLAQLGEELDLSRRIELGVHDRVGDDL